MLSQNVANVNVPGYQRLNVTFDEVLAQHMNQHGDRGVERLQPEVDEDQLAPARLDGNTVDIDIEMRRIEKNTLLNNTYLQILSTKTAMMRRAIDGR